MNAIVERTFVNVVVGEALGRRDLFSVREKRSRAREACGAISPFRNPVAGG